MTDIQPYAFGETPAVQIFGTPTQTRGERTREWLELFLQTERVAEVLAGTDFVPTTMKGKPAQVAAAMMKGYELDVDPLDALGNIFSVHGRIGFYAEFMRRRIIQAGHDFREVEVSDSRVILEGRRKGTDEWRRASFTADAARRAKLDLGPYPEDKLYARASSRLCKRVFPEVLSGAALAEDLEDEQAAAVRVSSERADAPVELGTAQRKRQPRRVTAPKAAARPGGDTPVVEEPELPGDECDAAEGLATAAQLKKLNTLLEQHAVKDKADKLDYLREQFGRPFTSSSELTKDEAQNLVDYLEQPIEPDSVAEAVGFGSAGAPEQLPIEGEGAAQ